MRADKVKGRSTEQCLDQILGKRQLCPSEVTV